MSETTLSILLTLLFAFIGLGVGVLTVSSHPDRVRAAKIFFSLAALPFAWAVIHWTFSTEGRLLVRTIVDIVAATIGSVSLVAGFRFANRS